MARINFTEVRGGVVDALNTADFDLVILNIPGASIDSRNIAVACQQVVWPGRANEIMDVALHGFQMHFRGRATTPHSMACVFVESRDMRITSAFYNWLEYTGGLLSGVSQGYKSDYALDGPQVIKYDTKGEVAGATEFYGLQIEDVPDVQLDGAGTNLYLVNTTLRYDYYLPIGGQFTSVTTTS